MSTNKPNNAGPIPRALAAQGVIGLSLCLGGYAAIVSPIKSRLASAQESLATASASAEQASAVEGSLATVMDRLAEAQREARAIEEAGIAARNQEVLYAAVSARAADLGIRVDEFNPLDTGRTAPGTPVSGRPGDAVLRCTLSATGSYADLAAFLHALGDEFGFGAVRAVRLSPTTGDAGGPMCHAEIQTEHYAADASPLPLAAPSEEHP